MASVLSLDHKTQHNVTTGYSLRRGSSKEAKPSDVLSAKDFYRLAEMQRGSDAEASRRALQERLLPFNAEVLVGTTGPAGPMGPAGPPGADGEVAIVTRGTYTPVWGTLPVWGGSTQRNPSIGTGGSIQGEYYLIAGFCFLNIVLDVGGASGRDAGYQTWTFSLPPAAPIVHVGTPTFAWVGSAYMFTSSYPTGSSYRSYSGCSIIRPGTDYIIIVDSGAGGGTSSGFWIGLASSGTSDNATPINLSDNALYNICMRYKTTDPT